MDQAETVLWNLIRGSSLSGLAGIRPVRRDGALTVIRPMLECGRDQIEDYLVQKNVSWRTDSTNADTDITRNAIRLEVLPLLEKLNPEAVSHIAQANGP
jgi:tRNA(Ile)-lysidine synthase